MTKPVAVILAAGQGKRMNSDLPKVLHAVRGRPMIAWVLDAVRSAGIERIVVVVGYRAELVREALADQPSIEFALQAEQLGTGHAVMVCEELLAAHDGPVLVLAGDTPLIRGASLTELLDNLDSFRAACVVGTAETEANQGLGRIVRDAEGRFLRIVEDRDATPAEKAICEINTGCYAFQSRRLFDALHKIKPNNRQAEYYLTDCAGILVGEGETVVASRSFDAIEAMGINTPEQLADVERVLEIRRPTG